MKLTILIISICSTMVFGQDVNVSTVTTLDPIVFETSGLLWLDGRLITHNDSGGGPYLYEIDTASGDVVRTVTIANASNVDWEDIAMDDEYIYVGDIGNNSGTREDLKIYKIAISDYLTTPDDIVYCDTIKFNYSDQIDFEPATYTTNYDGEALIAYNDSLYIFTKKWGDYKTNIYSLSKNPGDYSIEIIDEINVEGLITGADYDPAKQEILLTGYTLTTPFLYFIKGFIGNDFSGGNQIRLTPGFEGSIQIEGVTVLGNHQFLVSSEEEVSGPSTLHLITMKNFVGVDEMELSDIRIYPINDYLIIEGIVEDFSAKIFDLSGKLCTESNQSQISFAGYLSGAYIVQIFNANGEPIHSQKILYLPN